ncbi:hypothetical protein C8C85_0659 [Flavobacterium sp. 103]|uniref:hypothetical protein n=1 Tax=unclassified Flavobacterium TaxID=196869 RepID=UPI000D5E0A80|nr:MULTISPECIES: hypothetical protein [unclassified Flavobacterium]PVX44902.1 hypothetical protein C8C85_0659 [Flavobacterium sp. 103]QKJ62958.1 hypothetical protein HQN62_07370 [Flavobacterium sp. M31R6]
MIIKVKIFLFLMFLSSPVVLNAQEDFDNKSLDGVSLMTKELLIRNNKVNVENSQSTNQFLQNNNLVQIQQIGNYNYSNVYVRSYAAEVQLNQNGDNNFANVYRNAYIINENISQTGNNNFISDFSVYSAEPVNTTFNQYGNNLTIINNGSNSISKNLQINQTGNSGTVYIYNR